MDGGREELDRLGEIQAQETLPEDVQVTQDLQNGVHVTRVA